MKKNVLTLVNNLVGEVGQAKLERYCTSLIILSLTLFMLHLFSLSATAQTTTSTIEGIVTDANGAVVPGVVVRASSNTLAAERSVTTDTDGFYRLTALPAGTYTLTISQTGFATSTSNFELTLNRVATFNVQLQVQGAVGGEVTVTSELPLLEPAASSTGLTVTPRQITELPVNGRDYLDLLQLVPGVAINRQADPDSDEATPVLGERGGNNNFFIDGHPNKDTVNGGPGAQFNQETIAEFQVLTTGYKAEFGQASGGIINVITKSGGNEFHGVGSLFHRNEAFDKSNSLDETRKDAPFLRRFDYSLALGGPIIKDKVFFFGSAERITENRRLDFLFPETGSAVVDQLLRDQENPFDNPNQSRETRIFFKLNEQLGRHQLTQEVNYTNALVREFLPLSAGQSLPSTRSDTGDRRLLLAFGDTILLGNQSNPFIVTLRGAYRSEPSDIRPTHPEAGPGTIFNPFSGPGCAGCFLFGDLPQVVFGNSFTASNLNQKYTSFTANANKLFGDHDVKFGWNFLRTKVDGLETRVLNSQLFSTVNDFAQFGPVNSGTSLLTTRGGLTPEDDEIHLRNNYNGLFVQDDWKLMSNLTINLGLRWEHDSEFEAKRNFAPRLGFAWAVTPKTVVRANVGLYYDQFRLGLARNVPAFGGSDQRINRELLFPRGLYGSPSFVSSIGLLLLGNGPCLSNGFIGNLTDAEITAAGLTCPFRGPLIGVDRLNNVVAPGRSPIPANTVITISNVQALTGLTPDQYAAQASAAVGQPAGYFVFGPFGVLNNNIIPAQGAPTTLDGTFKTPNTLGFNIGVQREITKNMVVEVDYHHRNIRNLLGLRLSNLAFRSRVEGFQRSFDPPGATEAIITFGPFFEGTYDALIVNFNKRFSNRFLLGANYTYANATDNSSGIFGLPSDSFIGTVPEVTEPGTGTSNRDSSFTSTNGNFVAQAGTFSNGPDFDKGPSDLAVKHIFQINGLVELPWQFQVSGILRTQSGFRFSRNPLDFPDPDGDGTFIFRDIGPDAGRNAFTAPAYVNLDMRFTKRFDIGDRVDVDFFVEFFNLLNRQNPAAVFQQQNVTENPVGSRQQVLPGREGQVGFRIAF